MNTLQVICINTRLNLGSMYNEIVCKLSKNTGPTVFSCARHTYIYMRDLQEFPTLSSVYFMIRFLKIEEFVQGSQSTHQDFV